MHKDKLEGKKCGNCPGNTIPGGIQKGLADIVKSMKEATEVFKAKAEETAKKNGGTTSGTTSSTDDANKTSDDKKTDGTSTSNSSTSNSSNSSTNTTSSNGSSTKSGDTDKKGSEFNYVTKTGKTAHIFNVNQKGSVVEFDASFDGEKK